MGSLAPYLLKPGCWTRTTLLRGLCHSTPPSMPPPSSNKKDKSEASWNSEQLQKEFSDKFNELRSSISPSIQKTQEIYVKKANFWMQRYENFVGVTEVKLAQQRVIEAEKSFIESQEQRREMQSKISDLQNAVKSIHTELEKTFRGEDRYLVLVTQEHQVLKEEKQCLEVFKRLENIERDSFSNLSNTVRDSHEKERAQAEKTKYWSIIGSIFGSFLGIIGTTINNRLKMRELRELVEKASSGEALQEMYSNVSNEFKNLEARFSSISNNIDESLKGYHAMLKSMNSLTTTVTATTASTRNATAVVGPEIKKQLIEINSLYRDLKNLLYSISQSLSNETKNYFETSRDQLLRLEKSLAVLNGDTKKNFEEVIAREDSLRDKFRDIISFLLSQPWDTPNKATNSRMLQQNMANNKDSSRSSDVEAIIGLSVGLAVIGCASYVVYKFLGF